MKRILPLLAIVCICASVRPAWTQTENNVQPKYDVRVATMSLAEQKAWLDTLIPSRQQHVTAPLYLLQSVSQETNQRTICTEESQSSVNDFAAQAGFAPQIFTRGSAACSQLADLHSEVVLGRPDPENYLTGKILSVACTSGYSGKQKGAIVATFGYGALFTHRHECWMQQGPIVRIVLSREKQGYFFYVGTVAQVGGKATVSKYAVTSVLQYRATVLNP